MGFKPAERAAAGVSEEAADGKRTETVGVIATLRRYLALERDVLVLSIAMFAFSLGYQATNQYMGEYLIALGAGPVVVGLFGSLGSLVSAIYPYPGGAVSDRVGSRRALTLFGLLSAVGFAIWAAAPAIGTVTTPSFGLGEADQLVFPVGLFVGLLLVQCWKSLGLGATFAVVKQTVEPARLASGFAATETVRRLAFLLGPLIVTVAVTVYTFELGFRLVLAGAAVVALGGTVVQHRLYDATADSVGDSFAGLSSIIRDLRRMPPPLPPLLAGDTLVRFANGMVYTFFVIVVVRFLEVGLTVPVVGSLSPEAFFGILLGIEMTVALLSMVPISRLTSRVGLKPVVALGFLVYAVFPVLLVSAPADPAALVALFAFSGLRFAGLPAHKALIVGPAEQDAAGRVTGSYYLVRNTVTIPAATVGGVLYAQSPTVAFSVASAVGLVGVGLFVAFGQDFGAVVEA